MPGWNNVERESENRNNFTDKNGVCHHNTKTKTRVTRLFPHQSFNIARSYVHCIHCLFLLSLKAEDVDQVFSKFLSNYSIFVFVFCSDQNEI